MTTTRTAEEIEGFDPITLPCRTCGAQNGEPCKPDQFTKPYHRIRVEDAAYCQRLAKS